MVAHGLGISINGQDPRSNVYLLDGTPQNDFTNGPAGSAAGTVLGMETIREFRVETNAYSAEFGRNSGGQINTITKSGTNDLHGSLYHFHRNDNFDARNFFDRRRQAGIQAEPVRRDCRRADSRKTGRSSSSARRGCARDLGERCQATCRTENARRGIIGSVTYVDRSGREAVSRRVSAAERAESRQRHRSLQLPFNQQITQDFGQARIDHSFNESNQVFGRYTYDDADQRLPTDYPQFPRDFLSRNQFVTAEWRQVISPRTLNTVRLSFSRTRVGQDVKPTHRNLFAFHSRPPGHGRHRHRRTSAVRAADVGQFQAGSERVWVSRTGSRCSAASTWLKIGGLIEHYQDNMFNPTFGARDLHVQ